MATEFEEEKYNIDSTKSLIPKNRIPGEYIIAKNSERSQPLISKNRIASEYIFTKKSLSPVRNGYIEQASMSSEANESGSFDAFEESSDKAYDQKASQNYAAAELLTGKRSNASISTSPTRAFQDEGVRSKIVNEEVSSLGPIAVDGASGAEKRIINESDDDDNGSSSIRKAKGKRQRLHHDKISSLASLGGGVSCCREEAFQKQRNEEPENLRSAREKKLELQLDILRIQKADQENQLRTNKEKASLELEILKLRREEVRRYLSEH